MSICKAQKVKEGTQMSVYQDMFEARFNELRHDYAHANEGRAYGRPYALRTLLRRIAAR